VEDCLVGLRRFDWKVIALEAVFVVSSRLGMPIWSIRRSWSIWSLCKYPLGQTLSSLRRCSNRFFAKLPTELIAVVGGASGIGKIHAKEIPEMFAVFALANTPLGRNTDNLHH